MAYKTVTENSIPKEAQQGANRGADDDLSERMDAKTMADDERDRNQITSIHRTIERDFFNSDCHTYREYITSAAAITEPTLSNGLSHAPSRHQRVLIQHTISYLKTTKIGTFLPENKIQASYRCE
jgi:hypothetical protein